VLLSDLHSSKTAARHTSRDFVGFLREVIASRPGQEIHIILDNLSAHKTQAVREFLEQNPRVRFHFTPTYSSWLNQVEIWFANIERDVIAGGIFTSISDLARKLRRYINAYSANAWPIQWKAPTLRAPSVLTNSLRQATSFTYNSIKLSSSRIKVGDPVTIEGDVKNSGPVSGDEVVELYLTQSKASDTPIRVLAGFRRVRLEPGQSTHIGFKIDPRSIAQIDSNGIRTILPGNYTVSLGGAQPGETASVQTGTFTITGKAELSK
jgi:transposase